VFELHQEKGYPIQKLCELAEVSRQGYYKWLHNRPSLKELEDILLSDEIRRIYKESDQTFGVERIQLALKVERGLTVNIKRIRRIMRILGISSVIRRKKANYVKSTAEHIAENTMNREFEASKPNQKWFTDVTYLKYGKGVKAYLSAIIDRYDMSVVAWKISTQNDNKLVEDTLRMAFESNPGATPLIQVDRGSQYTSHMFWNLKEEFRFEMSMSRVSKCLDNQPIEAFWGTYKSEFYYRYKFLSLETLVSNTASYIDFYMNKGYVKKFDGRTPSRMRSTAINTLAA
jgi:putative transposase